MKQENTSTTPASASVCPVCDGYKKLMVEGWTSDYTIECSACDSEGTFEAYARNRMLGKVPAL